jgi:hypothetical protein
VPEDAWQPPRPTCAVELITRRSWVQIPPPLLGEAPATAGVSCFLGADTGSPAGTNRAHPDGDAVTDDLVPCALCRKHGDQPIMVSTSKNRHKSDARPRHREEWASSGEGASATAFGPPEVVLSRPTSTQTTRAGMRAPFPRSGRRLRARKPSSLLCSKGQAVPTLIDPPMSAQPTSADSAMSRRSPGPLASLAPLVSTLGTGASILAARQGRACGPCAAPGTRTDVASRAEALLNPYQLGAGG